MYRPIACVNNPLAKNTDKSDGLPARLWTDQTCLRRQPDPATDRSTWRGRGPSRSGWRGAEEERGGPETKWSGWSATECRHSRGSRRSSGKSLSQCLPGIRRSPVEKHSTCDTELSCWVMRPLLQMQAKMANGIQRPSPPLPWWIDSCKPRKEKTNRGELCVSLFVNK